jgi:hypothetical protein
MPLEVDSVLTDGTVPAAPTQGQIWYDAATDKVYVRKTSGTVELVSLGSPGSGGLVQTRTNDLATDASTNSTSFVTLLSVSITTSGGNIVIRGSISGSFSNANRNMFMQVLLDGVVVQGAGACNNSSGSSGFTCSLLARQTAAVGTHTIVLQWRNGTSSTTMSCHPASTPSQEHAALHVEEVNV